MTRGHRGSASRGEDRPRDPRARCAPLPACSRCGQCTACTTLLQDFRFINRLRHGIFGSLKHARRAHEQRRRARRSNQGESECPKHPLHTREIS
ncbi:hypothetical protein BURMUCF1_A1236 [Burkholderia multivorans ATCC BAA-247]|nr:hypothetical protein BURMUCF1_A1236 [Burkholderia multivorans ATCC BAA-247]